VTWIFTAPLSGRELESSQTQAPVLFPVMVDYGPEGERPRLTPNNGWIVGYMKKKRIIVIGAGPAGLMAAGQAAAAGVETLLFEKNRRPGRKLCITGKGRCNITNSAGLEEFLARFGPTGEFLRHSLSRFSNTHLMNFLEHNEIPLVTERGGRVFPANKKAPEVLAILLQWLASCGTKLKHSSPIQKLLVSHGRVEGVISQGSEYACGAAILATGGASYPATGSTGDGYRIAASVGHLIVPIRPALVPLCIHAESARILDGVSLRNTGVRMFIDGKVHSEAFGEVAFSKTSMAGPVILTLSGQAVDALNAKRKVAFSLDLKPALNDKKLDARISRDLVKRGRDPFKSFLRGLLPKQVVRFCLLENGISGKRLACTLTSAERTRLIYWLKNFRIEVTGYRPIREAIVTAGGISTDEIDPETMESNRLKGLYVAGEALDISGATGGYNLQAAFSTGWIAGRCAASAILKV